MAVNVSRLHDSSNLFASQRMIMSPAESTSNSPNDASLTPPPQPPGLIQFHAPAHVRQLRPMKSPLYVPAALRPTERPIKSSPATPPKSLHGSTENLQTGVRTALPKTDSISNPVDRVVNSMWTTEENLGDVTGEPTREHWKVSKLSTSATHPFFTLAASGCQQTCSVLSSSETCRCLLE
jgi:hypothetical protein